MCVTLCARQLNHFIIHVIKTTAKILIDSWNGFIWSCWNINIFENKDQAKIFAKKGQSLNTFSVASFYRAQWAERLPQFVTKSTLFYGKIRNRSYYTSNQATDVIKLKKNLPWSTDKGSVDSDWRHIPDLFMVHFKESQYFTSNSHVQSLMKHGPHSPPHACVVLWSQVNDSSRDQNIVKDFLKFTPRQLSKMCTRLHDILTKLMSNNLDR